MATLPIGYKQGKRRPYVSTFTSAQALAKASYTNVDHLFLFIAFATAAFTRLYRIQEPAGIARGEEKIGALVREYAYGDFFIDDQPPLGKLLYFFVAVVLQHWDARFEFATVGTAYPAEVPYVHMRLFSALCGVATVVLAYGTLRASGCRAVVALVGSLLVCVENSIATQSRLALLEGPALAALAASLFAYKKVRLTTPFSGKWFKFLALTGLAVGVAVSTSWSGTLTWVTVAVFAALDMWYIVGDLLVGVGTVVKHGVYRTVALLAVPVVVYLGCFSVHLGLLHTDSAAAALLSADFKATLSPIRGYPAWTSVPLRVSYGSVVTFKHHAIGGYLHSHRTHYETGSLKQQVTMLDADPDLSNEWIVEMKQRLHAGELDRKVRPISSGDTVRLLHKRTGKFLHVDDLRPPISEQTYNNEVNCEGSSDMDPHDSNYEWTVKIVATRHDDAGVVPMKSLNTGELVFQLVHRGTQCVLYAHEDKLPKWAYGQMEVMCIVEPTIPNTLWYIESNSHPLLNDDASYSRVHYANLTLWDKVLELHEVMQLRATKLAAKDALFGSPPENWPLLVKGMAYFDAQDTQVYLFGNVAVYVVGFFVISLVIAKRMAFSFQTLNPLQLVLQSWDTTVFYENSWELVLAWAIHYFPYFHTRRLTYLYQYVPGVYVSVLVVAQYLEYQMAKRRAFAYVLLGAILALSVFFYVRFFPLVYGTGWTAEQCVQAKWLDTWDFDCGIYEN